MKKKDAKQKALEVTVSVRFEARPPGSSDGFPPSGTYGTIDEQALKQLPYKPLRKPNRRKPLDS